jgi:peptidoglycan/LPS O-acetylase OafA/YrhL
MSPGALEEGKTTLASSLTPSRRTITQAGERRSARIESLRALAALAVVATHSYAFSTGVDFRAYDHRVILGLGFIGVDVFFALTGFLIFLPFARRDYGRGRSVELGGYALNRGLRILPLYYVVLAVVVLVDGAAVGTFGRFALFAENFRESVVAKGLDGPMWSLVVELHFYLLLPVLAWALARASRRSAMGAAALLVALAGGSVAVSETTLHPPDVWRYSLLANFHFFVPGMLLALLRARADAKLPGWLNHPLARADLWLIGALVIWLALFVSPDWEFRLLPVAALGSLLVVAAAVLPVRRRTLDRVLDVRALAVLGVASYSLYLWHWPVMDWLPHLGIHGYAGWLAFASFAVPTCVAVALVSYRLVEDPPLRLRRQWFAGSTAPTVGHQRAESQGPAVVRGP